MKRVGLFFLLLFCFDATAHENPPMNQINRLGAYAYDNEYLLSNMVYAVNERISALYKNYSVVTNCAGTNIVHNYWIDKIPIESLEVAWGTNTFEVEFTFTNTYQGETITNTFTNIYLDFEYELGSEPEGYLWLSNFSPQVIRHINNGGMFRGARYLVGKDVYTNVLLRVVSNDFSDVYGIRLAESQGGPYVSCNTSNLFFGAIQQNNFYKQKVFEKVIELMPYYVGLDVDQYTNFPLWIWGEWGPYEPHVFILDPYEGVTIEPGYEVDLDERGSYRPGVSDQHVDGEAIYPHWRYYSPPEWRFFSSNSLSSVKEWLTAGYYVTNYLQDTNYIPLAVVGSNLNERQYSFAGTTHGQGVLGWEVDQLQNYDVSITITEPYTLAIENPATNYFIEGITPSFIASIYDTNNAAEYVKTENAYPLFDVSYRVIQTVPAGTPIFGDCSECWEIEDFEEFWACVVACFEQPASTNEKTYRIIRPFFTEYGMKDLLSQRAGIYQTNSITALIETKSAYTNWTDFDEYDPITITNQMGLLQVQTNAGGGRVPIKVTDYRQYALSITQRIERGETTITNTYDIPGGFVDGQIDMGWTGGWHKATTFPSGLSSPAYTSYYETATNTINGQEIVTNYWEPNYDLTLRHFAYATNVVQERLGLLASDRPTSFDYDNNVYGFLWSILQQMTRTRPASFIYNTNIVIEGVFSSGTNYGVGLASTKNIVTYIYDEDEPVGDNGMGDYPAVQTNVTVSDGVSFYDQIIYGTDYANWLENETNQFAQIGSYFDAVNFVYSLSSSYDQDIIVVNRYAPNQTVEDFVSRKRWQRYSETSASTNYVTFDFYVAKDPTLTGTLAGYSSLEYNKQPNFWSAQTAINCTGSSWSGGPIACFWECDIWDDYFVINSPEMIFEDIGQIINLPATTNDSKINVFYSAPIPATTNIVGYDQTAFIEEWITENQFGTRYKCQRTATGAGQYRGGETFKEYLDLIWEWDFQYAMPEE
jgi:hypothetical protein